MSLKILKTNGWRALKQPRLSADDGAFPLQPWKQAAVLLFSSLVLCLIVAGCSGYLPFYIPLALVVGSLVIVWAFLRPWLAPLLVFLGAGLPSLLIPLPGHTMRPVEAALFLCAAIIITQRPLMRMRFPHVLALLFLGIAIISFWHVPVISHSLDSYGADKRLYAIILLVLALFVGTFLIGYIPDISSFLCIALLANLPFLLIGGAQALHIHLPSLLIPSQAIEVMQEGRLSGPSDSPTTFAFYLVELLVMAVTCCSLGERRWQRWISGLMMIVIIVELAGSGTRSAMLVAILSIIIVLIVTRHFKWLLALTLAAIPLVIVSLNTLLLKFTHNGSITDRLILWQVALKLIESHPWIGIGLEQFPIYYAKLIFSQATALNSAGISVHNQYLEMGMESGIFWPIVGVLLLLSILFICWKSYKPASRPQRMLLLTTIVIIISYLEISLVDVPLDKLEGAILLFLLAGMALGSLEQQRRRRARRLTTSFQPASFTTGQDILERVTGRFRAYRPTTRLTSSLPTPYMRAARTTQIYDGPPPGQIRGDLQITRPLPALGQLATSETLQNAPKTGRAVIIQLLSWAIAIPIIFPTTALLTRYLGPVEYGVYSFTLPVMATCALFTMTGIDSWLVRQLSQQRRSEWSKTLSYTAGARLFISLAVSGLAALVIIFLPLSYEERMLLILGVGTLTFSFSYNCLRAIYEDAFVAEQQVSSISLLSTINRVTTAGLIVLAVLLHFSLIWTYILITYSDLPFFIILHFYTRKHFHMRLRFSFAYTWKLLTESIAFTGYDALALLSGQADVLLLLPLAGSLNVGIYALALRITNPLINIAYVYVGSLYPALCAGFEKGRQEFSKLYHESSRILALGTIPMTIFVVIEAPGIINLLAGSSYAAAIWPTRFLMISVALVFFSQLTLRAAMAIHKERVIPFISGATLAVTLIGNVLLIARWQAMGASITAVLAELVSLSLLLALVARQVNLWKTLGTILMILLGNIPGLAFLLWQRELSLLALAPIFAVLTLLSYIATHTLTMQDVRIAQQIVKVRRSTKSEVVS